MARIEWSERAKEQLVSNARHIARDSVTRADKWLRKMLDSVAILERLPEIGSPFEEEPRFQLRELIVGNYRILYQYHASNCLIYSILRAEQDFYRATGNQDPS